MANSNSSVLGYYLVILCVILNVCNAQFPPNVWTNGIANGNAFRQLPFASMGTDNAAMFPSNLLGSQRLGAISSSVGVLGRSKQSGGSYGKSYSSRIKREVNVSQSLENPFPSFSKFGFLQTGRQLPRTKRQVPQQFQSWDFHPSSMMRQRLMDALPERKPVPPSPDATRITIPGLPSEQNYNPNSASGSTIVRAGDRAGNTRNEMKPQPADVNIHLPAAHFNAILQQNKLSLEPQTVRFAPSVAKRTGKKDMTVKKKDRLNFAPAAASSKHIAGTGTKRADSTNPNTSGPKYTNSGLKTRNTQPLNFDFTAAALSKSNNRVGGRSNPRDQVPSLNTQLRDSNKAPVAKTSLNPPSPNILTSNNMVLDIKALSDIIDKTARLLNDYEGHLKAKSKTKDKSKQASQSQRQSPKRKTPIKSIPKTITNSGTRKRSQQVQKQKVRSKTLPIKSSFQDRKLERLDTKQRYSSPSKSTSHNSVTTPQPIATFPTTQQQQPLNRQLQIKQSTTQQRSNNHSPLKQRPIQSHFPGRHTPVFQKQAPIQPEVETQQSKGQFLNSNLNNGLKQVTLQELQQRFMQMLRLRDNVKEQPGVIDNENKGQNVASISQNTKTFATSGNKLSSPNLKTTRRVEQRTEPVPGMIPETFKPDAYQQQQISNQQSSRGSQSLDIGQTQMQQQFRVDGNLVGGQLVKTPIQTQQLQSHLSDHNPNTAPLKQNQQNTRSSNLQDIPLQQDFSLSRRPVQTMSALNTPQLSTGKDSLLQTGRSQNANTDLKSGNNVENRLNPILPMIDFPKPLDLLQTENPVMSNPSSLDTKLIADILPVLNAEVDTLTHTARSQHTQAANDPYYTLSEFIPNTPRIDARANSQRGTQSNFIPNSPTLDARSNSQSGAQQEFIPNSPTFDAGANSQRGAQSAFIQNSPTLDARTNSQRGARPEFIPNSPTIDTRANSQRGAQPEFIPNSPTLDARTNSQRGARPEFIPNSPTIDTRANSQRGAQPEFIPNSPTLDARANSQRGAQSAFIPNSPTLDARANSQRGAQQEVIQNSPTLDARANSQRGAQSVFIPNSPTLDARVNSQRGAQQEFIQNSPTLDARVNSQRGAQPQFIPNNPTLDARANSQKGAQPEFIPNSPTLDARANSQRGAQSAFIPNSPTLDARVNSQRGAQPEFIPNNPTLDARSNSQGGAQPQFIPNSLTLDARANSQSGAQSEFISNSPILDARANSKRGTQSEFIPNSPTLDARANSQRGAQSEFIPNSPTLHARANSQSGIQSASIPNRPTLDAGGNSQRGTQSAFIPNSSTLDAGANSQRGAQQEFIPNSPMLDARANNKRGAQSAFIPNTPPRSFQTKRPDSKSFPTNLLNDVKQKGGQRRMQLDIITNNQLNVLQGNNPAHKTNDQRTRPEFIEYSPPTAANSNRERGVHTDFFPNNRLNGIKPNGQRDAQPHITQNNQPRTLQPTGQRGMHAEFIPNKSSRSSKAKSKKDLQPDIVSNNQPIASQPNAHRDTLTEYIPNNPPRAVLTNGRNKVQNNEPRALQHNRPIVRKSSIQNNKPTQRAEPNVLRGMRRPSIQNDIPQSGARSRQHGTMSDWNPGKPRRSNQHNKPQTRYQESMGIPLSIDKVNTVNSLVHGSLNNIGVLSKDPIKTRNKVQNHENTRQRQNVNTAISTPPSTPQVIPSQSQLTTFDANSQANMALEDPLQPLSLWNPSPDMPAGHPVMNDWRKSTKKIPRKRTGSKINRSGRRNGGIQLANSPTSRTRGSVKGGQYVKNWFNPRDFNTPKAAMNSTSLPVNGNFPITKRKSAESKVSNIHTQRTNSGNNRPAVTRKLIDPGLPSGNNRKITQDKPKVQEKTQERRVPNVSSRKPVRPRGRSGRRPGTVGQNVDPGAIPESGISPRRRVNILQQKERGRTRIRPIKRKTNKSKPGLHESTAHKESTTSMPSTTQQQLNRLENLGLDTSGGGVVVLGSGIYTTMLPTQAPTRSPTPATTGKRWQLWNPPKSNATSPPATAFVAQSNVSLNQQSQNMTQTNQSTASDIKRNKTISITKKVTTLSNATGAAEQRQRPFNFNVFLGVPKPTNNPPQKMSSNTADVLRLLNALSMLRDNLRPPTTLLPPVNIVLQVERDPKPAKLRCRCFPKSDGCPSELKEEPLMDMCDVKTSIPCCEDG